MYVKPVKTENYEIYKVIFVGGICGSLGELFGRQA